MTTLKTFIRWPGNKSKHFGKFEKYLPDYDQYDRYVEPFLGSGAVFLKIEPENWIINDLNKDNINCWKTVRDHPEYLTREIEKFGKKFKKMSKEKKEETCFEITEEKLPNMNYDKKRALNYLNMSCCSFNGMIFKNNKFVFPHLCPSIGIKKKYYFMSDTKLDNIENVSEFLNETEGKIYNTDYKDILCMTKKGDFVFLDPPYIEDHDYTFNYNEGDDYLNNAFLNELLEECNKLDDKGVMWMMTQAETKDVKKIFKNYNIKKFKVYRVSIGDYVNELVIMNY